MTCNSPPPTADKPALFTHYDVETLFHEFGHGLHHMLTKVDFASISGISGVEWDAVELPSQFMENWCWEKEVLDTFAFHYETGEKIPTQLFNKLIKTKNFNTGLFNIRQIEFALFDFKLHMLEKSKNSIVTQKILDSVRKKTSFMKIPKYNKFQNSFGHIFAGGYAAGYYSYKWAEVLSADAYKSFKSGRKINYHVGKKFMRSILEKGGSKPAEELFRDFKGRSPSVSALIKSLGL
jgi:oligopeptidase A